MLLSSKKFEKTIMILVAAAVVFSLVAAMFPGLFAGVSNEGFVPEYQTKLFGKNIVNIDIEIPEADWDEMLENKMQKPYVACDMTVDGEKFTKVGIRPKGNSSLTSIQGERISFRLDFDHYVDNQTCYGLEQMVMNNLQADATYMKDFIAYDLMQYMGVNAPLHTYANISLNGQPFGVYLLCEFYEEDYLERVYDDTSIRLYSVKSSGLDEFENATVDAESAEVISSEGIEQSSGGMMPPGGAPPPPPGGFGQGGMMPPGMPGGGQPSQGGNTQPESMNPGANGNVPQQGVPGNGQPSQGGNTQPESTNPGANGNVPQQGMPRGGQPSQGGNTQPESMNPGANGNVPQQGVPGNGQPSQSGNTQPESMKPGANGNVPQQGVPGGGQPPQGGAGNNGMAPPPPGGSGGGGDLVYVDDSTSSYSTIFANAVFDDTDADDYARVIRAIKYLNDKNVTTEMLEKYWDVDEILRYMAVHTFMVNGDSYYGNMQQNYFLMEDDGKISILPWDYNLSFGSFGGGPGGSLRGGMAGADSSSQRIDSTTEVINSPVDTPLIGVEMEDRPLVSVLLSVDEYRDRYHGYLSELADYAGGEFVDRITIVNNEISPYIQKETVTFFTYDEHQTAFDVLTEFVALRSESIKGQVEGRIPSTTEAQTANIDKLITADFSIDEMGSMGGPGGPPGGGPGQDGGMPPQPPGGFGQDGGMPPQPPGGFGQDGGMPQQPPEGFGQGGGMPPQPPGGFGQDGGMPPPPPGMPGMTQNQNNSDYYIIIIVSLLAFCLAFVGVKLFKRKY